MKKILALALACVLIISLTACGEKKEVPELLHPIETANAVYVVKKTDLAMRQTTGGYVYIYSEGKDAGNTRASLGPKGKSKLQELSSPGLCGPYTGNSYSYGPAFSMRTEGIYDETW